MNKKNIMTFSALQILVFHLWISISGTTAELFLQKTAYIGVDIFFFLSAYSLSKRKVTDIKSYYLSRLKNVYLKFAVFTIIAALVGGWKFIRVISVLTGIELFQKGGGAFLWFLPAIIIFYLLLPWIQKITAPKPVFGAVVILFIWFIAGILITFFTSYKAFFIMWNRIPVLVLGALAASFIPKLNVKIRLPLGILLTVIGYLLLWYFGFRIKLSTPIADIFYCMAIPAVLGIVLLIGSIPENKFAGLIGSATLEIYAVQMIWGFKLLNNIYMKLQNPLLANISTIILVILAGMLFNLLFSMLNKLLKF